MPITIDGTGTISGVSATGITTAQTVSATNITTGTLPFAQLPTGSVLQVVSFPYSTQFSTSSTSFTSTGIATSITPKFSTSKIFIAVTMPIFNTGTSSLSERFTIFRGTTSGTNLGVATWGMGLWNLAGYTTCAMSYLDSPATTSSTTYTVAISSEGGTNTVYSCPFSTVASITLMEIAA